MTAPHDVIELEAPTPSHRRRAAPYSHEVSDAIRAGRDPNVYVLTGRDAWQRAERRRALHGEGSALVLPVDVDPASLRWPSIDAVFVDAGALSRPRAIELGAALIADGVRYAAILGPRDELLNFWCAA